MRRTITAAMAALATIATLVGPAQAGTGVRADETLSAVTTAPGVRVEVIRFEAGDASSYTYAVDVEGVDGYDTCALTRDGALLDEDGCRWLFLPWMDLPGSGRYVLTADGVEVAAWTFTDPGVTPPPLPKAVCKVFKPKVLLVNDMGMRLRVPTNGKCKDGTFSVSYGFIGEGRGGGGFQGLAMRGGPKVFTAVADITSDRLPLILEVTFTPSERRAASTSARVTVRG